MDNLDRDVIRAERLGYGCHYGQYKADHPYTRVEEAEEEIPPKNEKQKTCAHCGVTYYPSFAGRSHGSKYCSERCYYAAARLRAAMRRNARKENMT